MTITLGFDKPSFIIDSAKRDAGTIENFQYTVQIDRADEPYNQIAVVSATIPKSYYDLSVNAILRVTETYGTDPSGNPLSVVRDLPIPRGDYNVNNLRAVVLEALNDPTAGTITGDTPNPSPPTYTMSYPNCSFEPDTKRFTWTHDKSYPVSFETIGISRIHNLLGFTKLVKNNFEDVGGVQKLTSTRVINLEHTKYIIVKSDISHNTGNKNSDPEVLVRIPVNDTDLSVVHYRLINLEDEIKTLVNHASNKYTFTLYDDDDRILDLNGNEWTMTLFISRYNNHDEVHKNYIKLETIEKINVQ